MREYQPAGLFVTAASTYANQTATEAPTTDHPMHSMLNGIESGIRSPMSTDSQLSLLTTASSSVSQSPQCDWPEFQENYNSIMDNTNLLDSCAAALNDISSGEDGLFTIQAEKLRKFNRSLSSTTSSSFGSDPALATSVTSEKCVEQFTKWLCEMENRVAAQPKLLKISAMKAKQKAAQKEIHSNIYKEIVAQPCIVKGNEHKSLQERYHVLYLKVYEVLILLEGLPANIFSPSSNPILGESFNELECSSSTESKEHSSDHVDHGDNEHEHFDYEYSDKTIDTEQKTPIYTETSVLSTSIGTYYFNYDDSIVQQQTNDDNIQLSSTIFENNDKEFTFEHDLHSLLNATDSLCIKSYGEHTAVSEGQRPIQQHLQPNETFDPKKKYIWNEIDFSKLAAETQPQGNCLTNDYHHKVFDWLHTKTTTTPADSYKSKSTVSLDGLTARTIEDDYRLVYRAKSEMDLSKSHQCHRLDTYNRTSSLHTSVNCLPTNLSPSKRLSTSLSDSIPEESSLIWDNFQLANEFMKSDSDFAGSDLDTKDLINKLCYFGDDYSMHLNDALVANTTESENESVQSVAKSPNKEKTILNVFETPPSSKCELIKTRRSRRIRNKRFKNYSTTSTLDSSSSASHSTFSLDQSSDANLSEATTASVNSNIHVDDSQSAITHTAFVPEQTISYNTDEKQFELHTKDHNEPKKMKINEMRPEDFYDIVKMCQSNIDCVITVLGAESGRILTVAYCQQMKYERYQKSNNETCKCEQQQHQHQQNTNTTIENMQMTKETECNCNGQIAMSISNETCICSWVSHQIAMILNFLIDCWNVFRNMKLYTYLCRVTKALFGSTRYVADHLKAKKDIVNVKAIKYS
ncbi:uncharacterized protein LOC116342166 [Contarinia nasturtii]|uniref:uncharacterized protein LOC116342166 n=1 Tax=Contarinia nasturtii TaxID=265458 RepID=UPI0012D471C1|nr:uncharacterized protein LOC116342166 [Contarinia nasturtii]